VGVIVEEIISTGGFFVGRRRRKSKKRGKSKSRRSNPWLEGDIVVWSRRKGGRCNKCGQKFKGKRSLVVPCGKKKKKKAANCLNCAGISSLAFLPAGDAKLTRRASKYSSKRAVVVRNRGKFIERCGILVESPAIARACEECAVATPAATFKPIAGTGTTLAPDARFGPSKPKIRTRSVLHRNADAARKATKRGMKKASRSGAGEDRKQRTTQPARLRSSQPNAPEALISPNGKSHGDPVELIASLIRQAYPNCTASRARKVAQYSVEQPETEDFLAYHANPDDVGILVSRYLRRRRTARR
jgi:hypothetical protein